MFCLCVCLVPADARKSLETGVTGNCKPPCARNQTQDIWKSIQGSAPQRHLSGPGKAFSENASVLLAFLVACSSCGNPVLRTFLRLASANFIGQLSHVFSLVTRQESRKDVVWKVSRIQCNCECLAFYIREEASLCVKGEWIVGRDICKR